MDYPTTINLEKYDMYSLGVALADGALPFKAVPDRYLFCDKEARWGFIVWYYGSYL